MPKKPNLLDILKDLKINDEHFKDSIQTKKKNK